jgi:hypothetical protein
MLTAAFKSERGTLRWPSLMAAMELALGAPGAALPASAEVSPDATGKGDREPPIGVTGYSVGGHERVAL